MANTLFGDFETTTTIGNPYVVVYKDRWYEAYIDSKSLLLANHPTKAQKSWC